MVYDIFGLVVSTAGLLLSCVLLWQVKRINEAKRQERLAMRELLFIDELETLMTDATRVIQDDTQNLQALADIGRRVHSMLGKVQGSKAAIARLTGDDAKDRVEVLPAGYYQAVFFMDHVSLAKNEVVILAHMNRRLAEHSVMEIMSDLLNRGVTVKIMSISEETPDNVLQAFYKKMPLGNAGIDKLKYTLKENERNIKRFINSRVKTKYQENFSYVKYNVYPNAHMVKVDSKIFLEIENPRPDSILVDGITTTPAIQVSADTHLGRYLQTLIQWYSSLDQSSE